jgi:cyanobactin maturation PatA/PatG family protease
MNNKIPGLNELKRFGNGSSDIKIAVLDGPVDLGHACFKNTGSALPLHDDALIAPSASEGLAVKHGTAVYSIIFGQPGSEVEGVAPGCNGLVIPIYSQSENGNFSSASQVILARAIEIAIEKGAHIINISGGQSSATGDPDLFLKQAIDKCYKAGILIVAASGNDGCYCLHVPAADKQVLAVGSMDENGMPTPQTNFGPSYLLNGILAPGKNLMAARAGGGTFFTNGGTSYATPVVSGLVGLLMSLQIKRGYQPDAYAIRQLLENTAIPCINNGSTDCRRFMRGKLNIPGALEAIRKNPEIIASRNTIKSSQNRIVMQPDFTTIRAAGKAADTLIRDVVPADGDCEENITNNETVEESKNPAEDIARFLTDNEEQFSDTIAADADDTASEKGLLNLVSPQDNGDEKLTANKHDPSNINFLKPENMEQKGNMENVKNSKGSEKNGQSLFASATSQTLSGEIDPSDCGCGCGGGDKAPPPAIVYALGTIGYDFGSESHRDSFIQSMQAIGEGNPHNPKDLLAYLKVNPWNAAELLWTLNIDATPVYALLPTGPYSNVVYDRIINSLEEQQNGNIQRISVPGVAEGTTSLLNGQAVTNLYPNLRGMYSWTTAALVASTAAGEKGAPRVLAENVGNFLNRIYYKMRNLGVTAEERALNYSATNAYQVSSVFAAAIKENLELDDIQASKSPICRPGADCYDVVLSFFNPKERLTQARKEYRFTVDVSDVVPVTVGEVRSWSVY